VYQDLKSVGAVKWAAMARSLKGSSCICRIAVLVSLVIHRACSAADFAGAARKPTRHVALSLEGGGFRAQSSGMGLISGLLAVLGQELNISAPTLAGTGLLNRFDVISSVSGSSWFMSSLMYSNTFHALVEAMAASVGTAASQMKAKWTTPWLLATNVDPEKFSLLGAIARDILAQVLGKGDEDTLYTLQYFLATSFTWNDFVAVLLNSTASIGPDVALGSSTAAWTNEKIWLIDHTLLLPSGQQEAAFYQGKLFYPKASYAVQTSASIPLMVPAKFSMKLGSGINSSAPLPYVASTAISSLEDFDYTGVVIPIIDHFSKKSGALDIRDLTGGVLVTGAGKLPVTGVTAASSAFLGVAPVAGIFVDEGLALTDGDVTPWVSTAPDGAAFKVANELVYGLQSWGGVNKQAIDALAQNDVHGVIDAGYTDGTGISHAVQAGADEILAVLNSNSTNDPFYVEILFKDGPAPVEPGSSAEIFPVFESPVASAVRSDFLQFHKLHLPSAKYLKTLAVGTLREAVTADNKFFGISQGRTVTLHIINICADLSIGLGVNFDNYDMLAQEIAEALLAKQNVGFVKSTLMPMLLGPGKRLPSVII